MPVDSGDETYRNMNLSSDCISVAVDTDISTRALGLMICEMVDRHGGGGWKLIVNHGEYTAGSLIVGFTHAYWTLTLYRQSRQH